MLGLLQKPVCALYLLTVPIQKDSRATGQFIASRLQIYLLRQLFEKGSGPLKKHFSLADNMLLTAISRC